MSSDGKRKATKGWDTGGASGETTLGKNKIVVVEEPTVPAMAAMNEAARAEAAMAEAAQTEAANTEVSAPLHVEIGRPRRTTIESFNDEMAALDRPLEEDVEYIDEKPPRRWSRVAAFIATIALAGGGGALVMARHRAAIATQAESTPPLATVALAAPAPVPAAAPPAAEAPPSAAAPAEADEPDETGGQGEQAGGAAWKTPSRVEWTKVRTRTVQSKHARSGGGKTTYRRVTTTTVKHHHVVVKRTVSGRR